jgi:putative transposase
MRGAIGAASRSPAVGESFRVVHFSIQNDHVHLIVEAHDRSHLSRGVQGLAIRLARGINDVLGVTGKVWGDRFHARDLRTPREVRSAIVYVLMNAKKHLRRAPDVDPFSSAPWFDGFVGLRGIESPAPVVLARTWLAREGWLRRGRITPRESPRPV